MVDAEGSKGAASGTRTHDLFVTNEMLYRLSYCGLQQFKTAYALLQQDILSLSVCKVTKNLWFQCYMSALILHLRI